MQRILLAGLALCAPALAQSTKSIVSPEGYMTIEGANYAYYLGRYDAHIHQVVEGQFRGAAKVMTGIQFRRDSTLSASSSRNAGRSFTNVSILLADADFDKVTTSFASNKTGAATTVFSAAYSMPSLTGFPLIKNPAVWGGVKGEFNFTFSKIWLYAGKADFVAEYQFSGGKLLNGGTWSSYGMSYYLDGHYTNTSSASLSGVNVPLTRINCNDSAMTQTTGAYTYGYGSVYGKNGSIVNYRGKVALTTYSYYVAPGKPIIHAFGLPFGGPFNVGAKCNLLHVNAAQPMVLVPFVTVAGHSSGYSGSYVHVLPWLPIMANLPVMLQGAWSDSQSGQFSLTQARRLQFPAAQPPDQLPKRKSVYQSGSKTGGLRNYVSQTDGYVTPISRYLHR